MNTQPFKSPADSGKEPSTSKAFYALMIMIGLAIAFMLLKITGLF